MISKVIIVLCLAIQSMQQVKGLQSTQDVELGNDESTPTVCPPWAVRTSNDTCMCVQGMYKCDDDDMWTVSVPECYCITYDEMSNATVFGSCVYTCHIRHSNPITRDGKHLEHYKLTLREKVSFSEDFWCDILQMNRTGQMCGKCKEGYSFPVYSYSRACVTCSNYKYNWLKYIAISLLPVTFFYIAVLICRLSATSGLMHSYVLISQLITSPSVMRRIFYQTGMASINYLNSILISFHAVWNLDFLRSVYTWYAPFCLHPTLSALPILALDYIIAVYPIGLIVITYCLVYLHDHYSAVVWLWRPFYRCFVLIRNQWEIRTNLVGVFATFLLLSYTKVLNVSFDLLIPTTLYDMKGTKLSTQYLYYDGTVEYFGKDHLPYAVLALFMLLLFNIIPLLLLCFYPFRCTHRCLAYLRIGNNLVLHTFMDAFQGWYKIEHHDYRCFSALYLLIRILPLCLFCSTTEVSLFLPLVALISILVTLLFAMLKPYKQPQHNYVNIGVLLWLILFLLYEPIRVYIDLHKSSTVYYKLYKTIYRQTLLVIVITFDVGYMLYGLTPRYLTNRIKKGSVKLYWIVKNKFNKPLDNFDSLDHEPRIDSEEVAKSEECTPLLLQLPEAHPI